MRISSPKTPHYIKLGLLSQFIILCLLCACQRLTPISVDDWVGFVGATDDRTAAVGEQILRHKGNAADAAVAMLLHQAVVLPSRAGLGSGGICQVLDVENEQVKTLTFLPKKTSATVAVPALPKGAFALQTRYGQLRWGEVVQPAYEVAQKPVEASALMKKDVEQFPDNLFAAPTFEQKKLAETLRVLMQNGTGTFYKGDLGQAIVGEYDDLLNEQHYQSYAVGWTDSISVSSAEGKAYFPNTAAVGRAAPDLWEWARNSEEPPQSDDEMLMFDSQDIKSASVMAVDSSGMFVVCSVSQGEAFGSKVFSTSGGFYLPAPIDSLQEHLFSAVWTEPSSVKVKAVMSVFGERALVAGVRLAQETLQKHQELAEAVKMLQPIFNELDLAPVLLCGPNGLSEPSFCQGQTTRLIVK